MKIKGTADQNAATWSEGLGRQGTVMDVASASQPLFACPRRGEDLERQRPSK